MKICAIIPVAGRGKRFASKTPKQYHKIYGQPIITITLQKFLSIEDISCGIVVAAPEEMNRVEKLLQALKGFKEKYKIAVGGKQRQDSVYNGLMCISSDTDIVIVHDGVRPLISKKIIKESIRSAKKYGACITAVPVKDTIKRVQDNKVLSTLFRENLWQVQTPQTFQFNILKNAHEQAKIKNYYSTDEAGLVEWIGHPVHVITGDYKNIKVTTADDIKLVEGLYNEKAELGI
jgi:2-C-methyl-D-erythritol 4-phosphate cytidylyltransferase